MNPELCGPWVVIVSLGSNADYSYTAASFDDLPAAQRMLTVILRHAALNAGGRERDAELQFGPYNVLFPTSDIEDAMLYHACDEHGAPR